MTRITIAEKDWERKKRERLEDETERLESGRIEALWLELKSKQSEHDQVPIEGDIGARHPNKQPNTWVSVHPNNEEFDQQPNQNAGLQGGDMGARHPWKQPNIGLLATEQIRWIYFQPGGKQ